MEEAPLWKFSKLALKKIDTIKNRFTSLNINFGTLSCQRTKEQTTVLKTEINSLYDEIYLKKLVSDYIRECYPDIRDLKVYIFDCSEFIGGKHISKYNLNVRWVNGVNECSVKYRVSAALEDYFKHIPRGMRKPKIVPHLIRTFSEDVILDASVKYGECIAPNLPLNMHNIKQFQLGGVPIYELALGELRLKKEVM